MNVKILHQIQNPREMIRQFTPNWFTMNMGTGILLLMIHAFPYPFAGQRVLSHALWWFDCILFILFSLIFLLRAALYKDTIGPLLQHPVQSMFLGAIPMGLVPIINGGLLFGMPVGWAQGLWWLDAILAVGSGWLVPYMMFTRQTHSLENTTAVWLLPIVACEVTASSGGYLAPHLVPPLASIVIAVSYMLWAFSVPLALGIIAIVFLRLALHKLPDAGMAASSWLVLGPLGTGALAMMVLGQAAPAAFVATPLAATATLAAPLGILAGALLWAYGAWWWAMAWFFTLRYIRDGLPFNMSWWGFTFPQGVYTAATLVLAHQSGFVALKIYGALLVAQLAGFWVVVMARTLQGMWSGALFHAPCLQSECDMLQRPEARNKHEADLL